MTGPVVRTLTCVAALALAASGGAQAQEAGAAAPPPAGYLTPETEQAHEIAPVVVDGEVLFRVRGFSGYPAPQRARLIGRSWRRRPPIRCPRASR
jgi:hypothetical protein